MRSKQEGRAAFPLGPILVYGFATAIAVWITWFLTHLPWLGLPERISLPVILGAWFFGMVWAGRTAPERPATVSLGAGLVTALLGLLTLGSKLAQPASPNGVSTGVVPSAPLIAAGFLGLGAAIGLFGGGIGTALRSRTGPRTCPPGHWLGQFAIVTSGAVAPLLFVGGLVTSTNSGMAVPDWPNTFGSNMFLYPLGPRAAPDVFLEHSHRLFGALVGLTVLTLMVWVIVFSRNARGERQRATRWILRLAITVFVLVCVQGVLGGLRVTQNSRPLALAHGVLAQLVFAVVVAIATTLSPAFQGADPSEGLDTTATRRLRLFSTGLLHGTILQLLLGAAYRHFRHEHILWTHAAFSLVVTLLALLVGISYASAAARAGPLNPPFSRLGKSMIALVIAQFALGWLVYFFGGRALEPQTSGQAIIRTVHQTNGAFLLASATAAFIWARRLSALQPLPAS